MLHETLELWSDLPVISPRRSRLFSLAPIGVGTDRQEALSSYMVRLARAHSVTPLDLCNHELLPITEIKMGRAMCNFVMKDAKTMNGLNKYAREAVKGFQQLTERNDLDNCTLLPGKTFWITKRSACCMGTLDGARHALLNGGQNHRIRIGHYSGSYLRQRNARPMENSWKSAVPTVASISPLSPGIAIWTTAHIVANHSPFSPARSTHERSLREKGRCALPPNQ